MAKTLYLMRHGETLFNALGKIQGWCDSPLTKTGIQQAKVAGEYLDKLPIDHAYSSTSERSCDTIEIALKNRMPYQRLKGLKEMNFGVYEGESEKLNPTILKDYENFFLPFGGESSKAVGKRMLETLTDIMDKPDHQNVLAVSHAGACVKFLEMLQDPTDVLKSGFSNCSIFKFTYDQRKFKLVDVIRF
ncbi:histidine phosphatase family protein [Pediococcus inopinatus]|uniref:histidine phosphatase family protein n=1 Tax=Pediococcus inopinatus TaxID=114090 RepID=UPI002B2567DA|nr:histidine phosphatase family protein [Pediococcus inopinatus]WPC16599.1 histidine phosphatase family protein [Pediococcus inopinatus]